LLPLTDLFGGNEVHLSAITHSAINIEIDTRYELSDATISAPPI
jgi:hypothetical protein